MPKFVLSLLALSLLLVGCGGPRLSVDPDWKDAPKNFHVIASAPYVANADDLTDDFRDENSFRRWFATYLDSSLTEYSVAKPSVKIVDDAVFSTGLLKLGDEFAKFPLPEVEKLEGIGGVVMAVHPVRFWRDATPCPNGGCIGGKHLNVMMSYTIVAVEDMRVLAYGVARVSDSFTFAMTRGNWESVIKGAAKQLLEDTPLKK